MTATIGQTSTDTSPNDDHQGLNPVDDDDDDDEDDQSWNGLEDDEQPWMDPLTDATDDDILGPDWPVVQGLPDPFWSTDGQLSGNLDVAHESDADTDGTRH